MSGPSITSRVSPLFVVTLFEVVSRWAHRSRFWNGSLIAVACKSAAASPGILCNLTGETLPPQASKSPLCQIFLFHWITTSRGALNTSCRARIQIIRKVSTRCCHR